MTAQKQTDRPLARSSPTTAPATTAQASRKPWKKKTPVEVCLTRSTACATTCSKEKKNSSRQNDNCKSSKRPRRSSKPHSSLLTEFAHGQAPFLVAEPN